MFSWSNSSGNKATSTATTIEGSIRPPEYTRQQHLDSYLKDETLSRSTRKVSTDDTTYDTVFQTIHAVTLILRVHLPCQVHPHAPFVRPPAMTLAGVKARHEWLDNRMQVVGFEKTQSETSWRQARILLGTAVHQVIQKLQLDPPEILEITDAGLRSIQPKSSISSSVLTAVTSNGGGTKNKPSSNNMATTRITTGRSNNNNNQSRMEEDDDDAPPDYFSTMGATSAPPPPPVHRVEMPKLPREFPELSSLSATQLDLLLEDELEFMSFCNKLPVVMEIHSKATALLAENAQQAHDNLRHESQLRDLHRQATELTAQLKQKVQEFEKLQAEQDKICAPPDLHKVKKDLYKAKRLAFEESEQIADDWLENSDGTGLDDFLKRFLEKRQVHHERAAKLELLQFGGGGGGGAAKGANTR